MSAGTWSSPAAAQSSVRDRTASSLPYLILKALGSLKITVTMFALGILLVLIGTLAQDELTLAEVKRIYFNAWWTIVPLDVFVPVTLLEHAEPYPGRFPFPGGATIGLVLLVNLIAAKTTRFKVHAQGLRMWGGLLISALGGALVTTVIVSGHAANGLQGKPPISYDTLWNWLKAGFVVISLAMTGYATFSRKLPPLARVLSWVFAVGAIAVSTTLLLGGESVRLDDPGLRIVWQLSQASIASIVLLIGLWCLFDKRGGNVLIHIGVALLMVGQFVFGDRQVEQRLNVVEGDSTNMVYIQDEVELVVVDPSDPEQDSVVAIPEARIRRALRRGGTIDDDALPCKIQIDRWMKNSRLLRVNPDEENLATVGMGLNATVEETKAYGAAESSRLNIASAYLTLIDRESSEPINTILVSQHINDPKQIYGMGTDIAEQVDINGKRFEVALRFRRDYKPYYVHLKDVERINYSGSDTPRDYSSRIVITDKGSGASIEERTWMNNPIRYQGETFYQSQHYPVQLDDGSMGEATGLQIVENAGWVIPYVCCMMVMVGMFAHFGSTFNRFAARHSRLAIANQSSAQPVSGWQRIVPPLICVGIVGTIAGYYLKPSRINGTQIDWETIARLPVHHEGRVKPVDTVAQNVLQVLSEPVFGGRPYVVDDEDNKRSQTEWLVSAMAGQDWVREAKVFRIYAKEVRDIFAVEFRSNYRYSYAELEGKREAFDIELEPLREKSRTGEPLDFREQKLSQMYNKLRTFDLLVAAYQEPNLPLPSDTDPQTLSQLYRDFDAEKRFIARIDEMHPPAMIPPTDEPDENGLIEAPWQCFRSAAFDSILSSLQEEGVNPATVAFGEMLAGVEEGDGRATNQAARKLTKAVAELPAAAPFISKVSTERWLNKFNPTAQGILLYLIVLIAGFATLATYSPGVRRTTFWLLVGVFVIHTIAILARMYISGRAPVINLYSSAVFIGWACVLFCIVLELVYPFGFANLVGGLIGLITLCIARSLDTSDTLHVLVAVLDTQFWLGTHVVTVTAGYAVTLLAGLLGMVALVHRMVTAYDGTPADKLPADSKQVQDVLYRMSYGAVCFGILFSFVGTVLGGLWADDSWGRFWGWDPKENGALMIVMWNAVVLHARWDKQVGARGFAILTVLGNIVTAWSWFGTNLLGIGLHNYGFSKSVAYTLVITVAIHLLLIGASLATSLVLTRSRARLQA